MNRIPIQNEKLREHLKNLSPDVRDVFLLHNNTVRCTVIQGTEMINQMRANHSLGILETLTLGHAYLAGGILASTVKGNDRVQLAIECAGPIKGISVEAWAVGAVRGYLQEVPIEVKEPLQNFDLSPFFGPGFLSVTKMLEGKKQPFKGQIMLEHGSIAKDLATYFLISEQTSTVVSLSIKFDKEGEVIGAGALFLQKLPEADDETLEELENVVNNMGSLGQYLSEGNSGKAFVEETFKNFDPTYLQSLPIGFSCTCSHDVFAQYLTSLPQKEKEEILTDGPFPLQLHCFNCGSVYPFEKEELQSLLG
ncbi:MAG: Hsp33 family molecular chaperone HslO [Sphaerochaetaceae bacterium]|nr:Hsp33 family molecular chaperone HslO [Sphaerochaetaceae bacterium]